MNHGKRTHGKRKPLDFANSATGYLLSHESQMLLIKFSPMKIKQDIYQIVRVGVKVNVFQTNAA